MKKRLLWGIIILLSLPLSTLSADVLSLDRETCISQALSNNSDLLNAALTLETTRRAEQASWNLMLPNVTASFDFSGSASIPAGSSGSTLSIRPGLSASLSLNPGIKESIRRLTLEVEKAAISYEDVRLQLLMNVESEFYYLLTSRSNLEIVRKNIELADRQYEQTKIKYQNGLVTELEVLQSRVNAANLVPSYSSLESSYKNRLKEFLVVLGIDPQTEVELAGSLEVESFDYNAEDLMEQYLSNRTDIRSQQKQIEILENSLNQARKNGSLPSFDVSASLSDTIGSPFSSSTWQDFALDGSASFTLGLDLGLDDYIPGSSTDLGIREIEDSIRQQELVLSDLIQTSKLEILNLVDSLKTDRENLELSTLNLELSEKSFSMTEESFLRGKTNRTVLDDAQQDLLTARQNLLESQYEYIYDVIRLRGALGLESLEDLAK